MNIEQTLANALSHGKQMPAVATEIRDIFKSGKERLQAVRDAAKSFADSLATKAEASLDAFKAEVEKIEKQAEGAEDEADSAGKPDPAPQPEPADPVVTTPTPTTTIAVVPAAAEATPVLTGAGSVTADPGTTVHVDTDTGVTTTVPHDGTDPTAMSATGVPVAADPAVVSEAVQATVDAGVTVAATATQPVI